MSQNLANIWPACNHSAGAAKGPEIQPTVVVPFVVSKYLFFNKGVSNGACRRAGILKAKYSNRDGILRQKVHRPSRVVIACWRVYRIQERTSFLVSSSTMSENSVSEFSCSTQSTISGSLLKANS